MHQPTGAEQANSGAGNPARRSIVRAWPTGAVLTAGGQRLYPEAQVLVAQYQQFQQRARRVALGEAGRLSLGFGLSSFHLAPQLVAAFRQRFPEVAIGLEDLPSERRYQLLLQGELQAGFVRLPVNTPLCGVALLSDRLVLAAPGALALRADDLMARFNLLPLLQLTPKRGRGLSDQSLRFIAAHRLTPNVVQQAGDIKRCWRWSPPASVSRCCRTASRISRRPASTFYR